jgi:hypothetical protein
VVRADDPVPVGRKRADGVSRKPAYAKELTPSAPRRNRGEDTADPVTPSFPVRDDGVSRRGGGRTVDEASFQAAVTEVAKVAGWRVAHFRAGRTRDGWRVPVAADATGWPDLTLVRPPRPESDGRSRRGRLARPDVGTAAAARK